MSWMAILLSMASSRVVVNGHAGPKFANAQGLRQGDPVSLLLFVIAMDVLTSLVMKAQESGVLSMMPGCTPMPRLSVYADDVVLFIRPTLP